MDEDNKYKDGLYDVDMNGEIFIVKGMRPAFLYMEALGEAFPGAMLSMRRNHDDLQRELGLSPAHSTLKVKINLDPVPGWGNNVGDHVQLVQRLLNDSVPHYMPIVEAL